jgi:hypothetical protein
LSQEKNQTISDVDVCDYVTALETIPTEITKDWKYKVIGITSKYNNPTSFYIVNDSKKRDFYDCNLFKKIEKADRKTGIENKTGLENKPHLCCFDPHLEYEMGMGMRAGANKHGWNNHRNLTADSAQQILDSLKRHLNAFLRGEEKDEETNTSHLACVGNNLNFLYRMTKQDGYGKVLENIYGEKK